ncbi:MAG TPA: sigma-54 dependent transcriptional regulator [Polyangia bacterium]|nr:sigma-54 dependent transcriptional regulator [Polyangia bacterium]
MPPGADMNRRLLVVDDDPSVLRALRAIFVKEGFEVLGAEDGDAGLAKAAIGAPAIAIVDLDHLRLDGVRVLERLRAINPRLPVVMLTGRDDGRSAVRALRMGAVDYITKPFESEEINLVVGRALEARAIERGVEELRRRAGGGLDVLMGPGPAVQRIIEKVRTVAPTSFSVLVLGETGTGKELVAVALHRESERRTKPFVALDCGAVPEALLEAELFGHEKGAFTGADRRRPGYFNLAESGTMFLDEIGNLPLGLQTKLLRVLESRQLQAIGARQPTTIDVRFVAATNSDLQARVKQGQFRSDLYFRLAQYTILLPALRERPEDISSLAERFMREVSVELRHPIEGIAPDALDLLRCQSWPGNVRELRNVVRQAVLESKKSRLDVETIQRCLGEPAASPPAVTASRSSGKSLKDTADQAAREAERQVIREALRATHGNKSKAARTLRTDFKTLHVKMKSLGIRARDFEV